jgi:diguanylate cyclase (GGDEF)-like protein
VETELFNKLFHLLQGLRQTADGERLYAQIVNGNRERAAIQVSVNRAFFDFVNTALRQYAKKPESDAATQRQADYIQQFISTYLGAYRTALPAWRPLYLKKGSVRNSVLSAKAFEQHVASMLWAARDQDVPGEPEALMAPSERPALPAPAAPAEQRAEQDYAAVNTRADELRMLRETVVEKISSVIGHNQDFLAQLHFLQQFMEQEDDQDMDQLRELMAAGTDELLAGHRELDEKLNQARATLDAMHAREQQIQSEVNKLLQGGLTDPVTGLPNRSAFVGRLEVEIDRAGRHTSPLALAILEVNADDRMGEPGSATFDEVMHIYANKILSQFRAYDMVARYGDRQFALLLPSAGEQQLNSALRNARQRLALTSYQPQGRKATPPGFIAGVAWLLSGEPAESFLARADHALRNGDGHAPAWAESALGT